MTDGLENFPSHHFVLSTWTCYGLELKSSLAILQFGCLYKSLFLHFRKYLWIHMHVSVILWTEHPYGLCSSHVFPGSKWTSEDNNTGISNRSLGKQFSNEITKTLFFAKFRSHCLYQANSLMTMYIIQYKKILYKELNDFFYISKSIFNVKIWILI